MPAGQITLASPADLDRAGLREFSRYSGSKVDVAGRVQLANLRKYYTPLDPWRRWVGVDAITSEDPWESDEASIDPTVGYACDPMPGIYRPHIFLSQSRPYPWLNNRDSLAVPIQAGWHVPSNRPNANDAIHEGMHPVGGFAIEIPEINRELEHRVTTVLGTRWRSDHEHSARARVKITASLGGYAAESPKEMLTEALVDWNEFGYGASPLAIAVGSTIDRYLTRSQGAVEVLAPMTQRYDHCYSLPVPEARGFSRWANVMVDQEKQKWVGTSGAYWKAIKAGNPPPMPRFEPLDLRSRRPVTLFAPSSSARPVLRYGNGHPVIDNFSAGGIDSDLALVLEIAKRDDGLIIHRPVGVEPPFAVDTSQVIPSDDLPTHKTTAQLLRERSANGRAAGVLIPDSWQIPKLQQQFGHGII